MQTMLQQFNHLNFDNKFLQEDVVARVTI